MNSLREDNALALERLGLLARGAHVSPSSGRTTVADGAQV